MKIQKLVIVLFASIVIPATSLADDMVDYCVATILDVQIELFADPDVDDHAGVCFDNLGWGKKGFSICDRLDSKLGGAIDKIDSDKLVKKKVEDAVAKLDSFEFTIEHLAVKGIIEDTPVDNSELSRLIDAKVFAASCVDGLLHM